MAIQLPRPYLIGGGHPASPAVLDRGSMGRARQPVISAELRVLSECEVEGIIRCGVQGGENGNTTTLLDFCEF